MLVREEPEGSEGWVLGFGVEGGCEVEGGGCVVFAFPVWKDGEVLSGRWVDGGGIGDW